jgi:hypothetical protein
MAVLLMATSLFAGSNRRRGTAGAQELLIPVGSVGTAMGGSYLAVISGLEAAYWNPAGVANMAGNGEVMFSHLDYIADIDVEYAAIASRVGGVGVLGATLKTVNFGNIPVTTTTAPDGTGEVYSPRYMTMGLLYSRVMTDRIRFGVKVNIISEQVMRVSANGVALNAGVQYVTRPGGFMMGVALRNLGIDMLFTGPDLEQSITPPGSEPGTRSEPWRIPLAGFEIPTQLEIGVAYGVLNSDNMNLIVSGSFLNDNFSLDQYTVGAELEIAKIAYLRGSYALAENPDEGTFHSSDEEFLWGPGFGAGLNFNFGGTHLNLDYAMRPSKFFANNQWLTLRFGF